MIVHATDANFDQEVLKSDLPVLVDFWGEWCGPCKAMAPMLEQLAGEFAGRAKVAKIEMDKHQRVAMTWRVRSAPTLLLFRGGAVVATHIGMASKADLSRLIEKAL